MEEKVLKATGIVRRIDDLGRIVIPKEIRRTLHIRESDPMEIFTSKEGEIILKKYSPIGEMSTFAKQYAESLAQVSGKVALIADRDQFIATAGGGKAFNGKGLSRHLEDALERRETISGSPFKIEHNSYPSISGMAISEIISWGCNLSTIFKACAPLVANNG